MLADKTLQMDNESVTRSTPLHEIDELEIHLASSLSGRVQDFHLQLRGVGLVLQGHARTYYAKQLAQQAVMAATSLRILANDIEVS